MREDFPFLPDPGSDNGSGEPHLEIPEASVEKIRHGGPGIRVGLLEGDDGHGGFPGDMHAVFRAVEVDEAVHEGFHEGGRPEPVHRGAEDDNIALYDARVEGVHVVVLAARLPSPTGVATVALADAQVAEQHGFRRRARIARPFEQAGDEDVSVAVAAGTADDAEDTVHHGTLSLERRCIWLNCF